MNIQKKKKKINVHVKYHTCVYIHSFCFFFIANTLKHMFLKSRFVPVMLCTVQHPSGHVLCLNCLYNNGAYDTDKYVPFLYVIYVFIPFALQHDAHPMHACHCSFYAVTQSICVPSILNESVHFAHHSFSVMAADIPHIARAHTHRNS